jgi:prevent-host-death family protein
MYTEIGAFDAKAKLSELLREVRAGQRYTITVRGEPVADLVPYTGRNDVSKAVAVAVMQQFKRIKGVGAEEISAWIAEGRK